MQCSNSLRFRAIVWYCMHGVVLFSWLYLSKCDLAYVDVWNINHKKNMFIVYAKGLLTSFFLAVHRHGNICHPLSHAMRVHLISSVL